MSTRTAATTSPPAVSVRIDAALAVLRVVTGVIFFAHGLQKVFVFGLGGVAGAFSQMGIPLAGIAGPAVALIELVGGLLLVAGVLTRTTALALAGIMVGAIFFAHIGAGFFAPDGFEFPLMLLAATAALALTGPGSYAVETALARRK